MQVALVGSNGVGKSMLIKTIAGVVDIQEGNFSAIILMCRYKCHVSQAKLSGKALPQADKEH
ncbi:MAG: ATP-binding cassette domain-containing protein [bacterium]